MRELVGNTITQAQFEAWLQNFMENPRGTSGTTVTAVDSTVIAQTEQEKAKNAAVTAITSWAKECLGTKEAPVARGDLHEAICNPHSILDKNCREKVEALLYNDDVDKLVAQTYKHAPVGTVPPDVASSPLAKAVAYKWLRSVAAWSGASMLSRVAGHAAHSINDIYQAILACTDPKFAGTNQIMLAVSKVIGQGARNASVDTAPNPNKRGRDGRGRGGGGAAPAGGGRGSPSKEERVCWKCGVPGHQSGACTAPNQLLPETQALLRRVSLNKN